MNDFNLNSPDDFSDETLDPQEQAERDRLKAQARKEREFSMTCPGEQALRRAGSRAAVTKTIIGEKDNFRGELTYQLEKKANTVEISTLQYRITRLNGQSGGNKANIECSMATKYPDSPHKYIISPDAMWQDGTWHNWFHTQAVDILPGASYVHFGVSFIFDKSGSDPYKQVVDHTYFTEFS
ncbi:hypothetical protein [Pseudomonas sp. UV AK001]|uniref:hypothetical protein n=1 Tax=Pseudomonas sp. UV AK001 TaxID=3384791 RepID=UPI0038D36058